MKTTKLTLLLFFLVFKSYCQTASLDNKDQILFKDGKKWIVEITTIQKDAIIYQALGLPNTSKTAALYEIDSIYLADKSRASAFPKVTKKLSSTPFKGAKIFLEELVNPKSDGTSTSTDENSNEDCKLVQNEKDEFLGIWKKTTAWGPLMKKFTTRYDARIRLIDQKYLLDINYSSAGTESMVIGTDDALMLKLSNDSIIKVFPTKIFSADLHPSTSINYTSLNPTYSLSEADVEVLKKYNVVKIRLYLSDSYLEEEVKPDYQGNIKKLIGCVQQ